MKLLRELSKNDEPKKDEVKPEEDKKEKPKAAPSDEAPADDVDAGLEPTLPEGGWNVGHLANHGILLSCDGFSLKLDLDQLNVLFDLAEEGDTTGEVRDHSGQLVTVEVQSDRIILTREGDETYPGGVVLDLDTLKEMGIEQHEDAAAEAAEQEDEGGGPDAEAEEPAEGDTIDDEAAKDDLDEGIKKAFRRSGNKIKRGFRVTSGFRKGRVVAKASSAFKPRAKAKTRMKLRIAGRKKRIIRLLKSKRTRKKSASKRLARMNKSVK